MLDCKALMPNLVQEVSCWQIGGQGEDWRAGLRSALVREVSCWLSVGRERVGELDGWSTLQPMGLLIGTREPQLNQWDQLAPRCCFDGA